MTVLVCTGYENPF